MGRFNKYLGKTEITVDGEFLELDVTMADKEKFISVGKGEMTEDKAKRLTSVIVDIMKRSYPDEPMEETVAFVTKNLEDMLVELAVAFKWTTRDAINKELAKNQLSL